VFLLSLEPHTIPYEGSKVGGVPNNLKEKKMHIREQVAKNVEVSLVEMCGFSGKECCMAFIINGELQDDFWRGQQIEDGLKLLKQIKSMFYWNFDLEQVENWIFATTQEVEPKDW
jgi:hypothetical protein